MIYNFRFDKSHIEEILRRASRGRETTLTGMGRWRAGGGLIFGRKIT